MSGRLEAIWIKRSHAGKMDPVVSATLVAGKGIVGNADQGRRRQVTLIEREIWERMMKEVHSDAAPSVRRANLMVSGISLAGKRGSVIRIGACRIRIQGETKPCNLMEESVPGLQTAMFPDWRGGAFGEVLDDGDIAAGDLVDWAAEMEQRQA
ncbi:MAG: MOSC domain-containing protein [Gemmatimonadota bacterium]